MTTEKEIKSDLEYIYKISGDLLNLLQTGTFDDTDDKTLQVLELIKFKLADILGVLQKDIYNCDYLETREKSGGAAV